MLTLLTALGRLRWTPKAGPPKIGDGLARCRLFFVKVEGVAGAQTRGGRPVGVAPRARLPKPRLASCQPLILQHQRIHICLQVISTKEDVLSSEDLVACAEACANLCSDA